VSDAASIWWIRQDLRLDDNPALLAAIAERGPVLPAYIWAPEGDGDWPPGAASRWWLHHSLADLDTKLRKLGSRLILRRGPAIDVLQKLVRETGATDVFWNERYEPAAQKVSAAVEKAFENVGVGTNGFHGSLLFDPAGVLNQSRRPFQVFTPYWNACLKLNEPAEPQPAPVKLKNPATWPKSDSLADLDLLPTIHWTAGMEAAWQPGETGATAMLRQFGKQRITDYPSSRDRPDRVGTSRLSPHLHFGEISPRRVWHSVTAAAGSKSGHAAPASAEPYLRQLGWREFSTYLLHHFPHTESQPMREEFARFPWKRNAKWLRKWQRGQTGYPIVDAGMRELWATGWMHNRVRMIVASFLVKDLLISWRDGADWFWDTLVDADLANNTMGWQWTAGCGADAAPYFRIFNPVLQGEKFDPQGAYVRRWVPELAKLPDEWIHRPWEALPLELASAGVELGKSYPRPIVDHKAAREAALAALKTIQK
jgi:deoxyribodipyrimidine photo-lyase